MKPKKSKKPTQQGDRIIRARGIRREPVDLKKLARAFIDLAKDQTKQESASSSKGQNLSKSDKKPGV
jgi:hypothetical protein